MTRGRLIFITDLEAIDSPEFNGDMQPDKNGRDAIKVLCLSDKAEDFYALTEMFDKDHFGYAVEEGELNFSYLNCANGIDFSIDFYTTFGSDYIYVKNASRVPQNIVDKNRTEITIQPGEIKVFYFGVQDKSYIQVLEDDIKEFTSLKNVLSATAAYKNEFSRLKIRVGQKFEMHDVKYIVGGIAKDYNEEYEDVVLFSKLASVYPQIVSPKICYLKYSDFVKMLEHNGYEVIK